MASRVKLFTKLREEMKDEGFTENQIIYAREICRGYNKEYIDQSHTPKGSGSEVNFGLESLNPEVLDPFSQEENLAKVKDLDDVYGRIKYTKDKIEKYADEHKIPLVDHEPNKPKTEMEKDPEPNQTQVWYATDRLETLIVDELVPELSGLKNKEYNYPSKTTYNRTEQDDKDAAAKINSFANMIPPFIKLLRSCRDGKYSFSLWKHAQMRADVDNISKHGAATKAKVEAVRNGIRTGEFRKMTRERAGDEAEEILQWMKEMSLAMADSAYWNGFIEWRDELSDYGGYIAARKIDLEDEFSEKAIG